MIEFHAFFEIELDSLPGVTMFNVDAAYMYLGFFDNLPPVGETYLLKGWIEENDPGGLLGSFIDRLDTPHDGYHPIDLAGLPLYATGISAPVAYLLADPNFDGHTIVPVPRATVLGLLGLGIVVWLNRRF